LFADLFTVYLMHVVSLHNPGNPGYLETVNADGDTLRLGRETRIRELARQIVPQRNQNMIQVLSNANDLKGVAWISWYYDLRYVELAATSIDRNNEGATIAPHCPVCWHSAFIHEFGHSFGKLADERVSGAAVQVRLEQDRLANAQDVLDNCPIIKWQHWYGHRRVSYTPPVYGGSAVPAGIT
jgi:hypothetical protein